MRILSVAIAFLALAGASEVGAQGVNDASSTKLDLRCDGVGIAQEAHTSTANVFDSTGHSASGSETTLTKSRTPTRVLFELVGSTARIQFPKTLVPPIHDGGADGWWPMYELSLSDTEISGRFRLNIFNKPTVHIDRINGGIEINGLAGLGFEGTCEPEDRSKPKF